MTDDKDTALVTREPFSLTPRNLTEAMEYAKLIASTDLVPQQFRGKPGDVLIAVQMGAELGISPIQSLQNIAVINGRPTVWGDAVIGLVQASGLLEFIREEWNPRSETAVCTVQRKGRPDPVVKTFSMADAKRAGLAGKQTYLQYGPRMCQMRARSWALRDEFADVLKGISVREEAEDIPTEVRAVQMPRRIGEAASPVEEFTKAPTYTEPQPPTEIPKLYDLPDGFKEWYGILEKSNERSGTTKGRDWTIYEFITESGDKFGTFSESMRDSVAPYVGTGEPVTIRYSVTSKGNWNIEAVQASDE